MSNRFYNFVDPLIAGSVARSNDVNVQFAETETGFVVAQQELNCAIQFPDAESTTRHQFTQTAAQRQGYMVGFDAAGALAITNQFYADWNANNKRIRNVPTALANDEPVTLAQMSAYSAGLTGLPSIAGKNGPLTTDGATVIWDSINKLVPSVSGQLPSAQLTLSGGTVQWAITGKNIAFDPNGTQSTTYWTTSLTNVSSRFGYYWRNAAPFVTQTFDHVPTVAGYAPFEAAQPVTAAVTLNTTGTTAGAINVVLRYYNSVPALISESAGVAATMAQAADQRIVVSGTTPALTAYVVCVVKFAGVSASASGVSVRDMKVESGSVNTPFDDFNTAAQFFAAKATNTMGYGFATPQLFLGNATSTTSVVNWRSQTGVQNYDARIQCTGGTNGSAGRGTLTIEAKVVQTPSVFGATVEYNAGNSGAAITIDFLSNNSNYQKVTLNAATPAITVSGAGLPIGNYQLKVVQDATGGRLPTWVGFVAGDCVGNAFPVMASAANGVTFVRLYWDGTQFWVSSNAWD